MTTATTATFRGYDASKSERSGLQIFSGNANRQLARDVCAEVNVPLGKAQVTTFSDGEVRVDVPELIGHTHAHAVVDERRTALGVEGDDVERRPGPPVGAVGAGRGVPQERPQHALRAAGDLRPANPRPW